ncbi:hypothetical protein HCB17_05460 [Salinispora arenicola]|uniref:hypothetical protein n=1 Tax=Salinispora arenicola TaxID=168697 RepID=UPI00142FCB34|nr:hypothetical protein [Salinispora arenicola]NIL40680.1 hypothetical protein [Salinispora arenicola]
MLVSAYDSQSSRQIAGSITVRAVGRAAHRSHLADTRVIDVGGGWHAGTWRADLRRLADRTRVTALALRTQPGERQLSDHDWSEIVRGIADRIGLADRPWVAVRTNPTTLTLLTDATNGPLHTEAARAYARTPAVTSRTTPTHPRPASATPTAAADPSIAGTANPEAPPNGVAQLSFAAPPTAAPGAAASSPAHQPAGAPIHGAVARPHTR